MRSMASSFWVALVFLFAIAAASAARAEDCKPLRLLNSVQLESRNNGTRFLVPVTIDGTPETLILDTGGVTTSLSPRAVKSLGLKEEYSRIKLYDMYGNDSNSQVEVKTFDLGHARGKNIKLQVSPMHNLESEVGADGLLSTDLFLQYDIDLDFAAARLNYFSQDHCPGRVAYWPERPLSAVPFTLKNGHIEIPITLDGHKLTANIDTGADNSVISIEVAINEFGLSPGSADMPLVDTSKKDPRLKEYSHNFSSLSFKGLTVTNPHFSILTDRMGANQAKSSIRGTLSDPYTYHLNQVIIGMDVLKHLHLYIAFGEKMLYISPAGTGQSALFQSVAAPAK